jgi:hypothetical protein
VTAGLEDGDFVADGVGTPALGMEPVSEAVDGALAGPPVPLQAVTPAATTR